MSAYVDVMKQCVKHVIRGAVGFELKSLNTFVKMKADVFDSVREYKTSDKYCDR